MYFGEVAFGPNITLTSAGAGDLYVAKLNPAGEVLWAISTGGSYNDNGDSIAVDDAGNVYVVGSFRGNGLDFGGQPYDGVGHFDILTAKISTDGVVQWVRVLGGFAMDLSDNITVDGQGNVYVTGQFWEWVVLGSETLTSNGRWDMIVAKYDTDGTPVWGYTAGGVGDDDGRGIAVDSQNNVYVSGVFHESVTIGTDTLNSNGGQDNLLTKLDSDGNPLWATSFGCDTGDYISRMAVGPDGDHLVVLAHYESAFDYADVRIPAYGSWDAMVAKIDTEGKAIWARPVGSIGWDAAQDVAIDDANNIFVVGPFSAPTMFGYFDLEGYGLSDLYFSKFSPDGSLLNVTTAGGPEWDQGLGIAIDSTHAYVAGRFSLTTDFQGLELTADGVNSDIFVWKTPLP